MQFSTHTSHIVAALEEKELSPEDGCYISDPIVMATNAGWYIGQVCREASDCGGMLMPWDRLTHYMSEADAIKWYDMDYKLDESDAEVFTCAEAGPTLRN
jgi:hypothetical protein